MHKYTQTYLQRTSRKWKIISIRQRLDATQCNTFCAWTTVLGNPSRMKPFWHEGFWRASSIMPTTKSSETSSPCKIIIEPLLSNNLQQELRSYSNQIKSNQLDLTQLICFGYINPWTKMETEQIFKKKKYKYIQTEIYLIHSLFSLNAKRGFSSNSGS